MRTTLLQDISEAFGDKVAVHYYHATLDEQHAYEEAETSEKTGNGKPGSVEHVERAV